MSKLTTYFGGALGKHSVLDAVKAGGWKVLIDGTLAESLVGGRRGKLVGVDQFGNKYYEETESQIVRDRWVVYANATDFRKQEPTTIPPEWHGWLNHITDENPTNAEFKKPIYGIAASANPTGTAGRYLPKGSWSNPEKRNWKKFQPWTPPSSS